MTAEMIKRFEDQVSLVNSFTDEQIEVRMVVGRCALVLLIDPVKDEQIEVCAKCGDAG